MWSDTYSHNSNIQVDVGMTVYFAHKHINLDLFHHDNIGTENLVINKFLSQDNDLSWDLEGWL